MSATFGPLVITDRSNPTGGKIGIAEDATLQFLSEEFIAASENSFPEIIKNHDASTSAQPAECFLMQLGPCARTRTKDKEANRFAAVAERHHEQPGPSIFAAQRIANHGASAVIDLAFFSGGGADNPRCFRL